MSKRAQLPWFRDLAVGDILQERSGAFRAPTPSCSITICVIAAFGRWRMCERHSRGRWI